MKIETLRKLAAREEIDYPFLLSALKDYAQPRDKISAWIKSGELIRVKKGLYVFGKEVALVPFSQEVLANLIYGPSAVSLSYALSYYGLIPERVSVITSITTKRNKDFMTPVGRFTYQYVHPKKYVEGIIVRSSAHVQFLMATPEKALCDQIAFADKRLELTNIKDIESYLLHDLRINADALEKIDATKLSKIEKVYRNKKVTLLLKYFHKRNI